MSHFFFDFTFKSSNENEKEQVVNISEKNWAFLQLLQCKYTKT